MARSQVCADMSLGDWLWHHHGETEEKRLQFSKVRAGLFSQFNTCCNIASTKRTKCSRSLEAMADLFMIPEVAKLIHPPGPLLKTVPATARTNVFCTPWQLDMSEDAKVGRYPSMVQTRAHLPSVVWKNYRAELEALDLKFTSAPGCDIEQYSVRYVDGHNKGLMVQGILSLVIYLATCLH